MSSSRRPSDVVIRLAISQNHHEVFVWSISHRSKNISGCVCNGFSSGSSTTHITNSSNCSKNLLFCNIVCKAELCALIICELYHCNFGTNICDLKCFGNITNKFKHEAEVAVSNTAGTVNQESYVDRIVASLAAEHLFMSAQFLNERFHVFCSTKPSGYVVREEAIVSTNCLFIKTKQTKQLWIWESLENELILSMFASIWGHQSMRSSSSSKWEGKESNWIHTSVGCA